MNGDGEGLEFCDVIPRSGTTNRLYITLVTRTQIKVMNRSCIRATQRYLSTTYLLCTDICRFVLPLNVIFRLRVYNNSSLDLLGVDGIKDS